MFNATVLANRPQFRRNNLDHVEANRPQFRRNNLDHVEANRPQCRRNKRRRSHRLRTALSL